MTRVLTIDLEDWFHSLEPDPRLWYKFERRAEWGTNLLLESLEKYESRATFFVLGDVARKQPHLIALIKSMGHEIGTHGMFHRFVYMQKPQKFREDLRTSIDILESITGTKLCSYRAPYFSITENSLWALNIVREEGLTYDSSIFPVRNSRYGMKGARCKPHEIIPGLFEWPITTLSTPFGNLPFAGGVYFRFLPWRIVYTVFQRLQKANEPILMYLHPWEMDAKQPHYRSPSKFLNFRHYWRLGATQGKLEQLLKRLPFATLAEGMDDLRAKELL
jgi:polysaccharide deacetylase family protein (PEP-CTERM system associated)